MMRQFVGLQKLHNRNILDACVDCAIECNDKIVRQRRFTRSGRFLSAPPPRVRGNATDHV